MPQRVILDGLWCGQGMANMVRIYKDLATDPKTKPSDYLCVFDFGSGGLSASKKVLGITPPVAFMMEQLELQVKAGRTATIDLMLISHQDRDHWQLLGELNEQIVKRGMTVVVGEMILSGANWRASSKTAVKKFIDRAKGYYWYDGEFSSYYDPAQPLKPLNVGDMSMTMLVTNVATNDTKEDIDRNCSSAVVLLQLGQLAFILPGDATWETFARLQQIMKPLPFVYAASVPHHGALRTMNRNTSVVKPDLQDLIWFTDYARPTSIYASAGIKNTHSHPYRIVLETMGRYTSAEQFQQRPIVVFNGATSQFELLPDIRNNIYTTVLNLTTPAQTANWIFNITPTTHDTSIQLFNAGVPGILSAPELSEMELAAQRANAMNEEDFSMIVDDDVADFPFPRSKVLSGPTMAFTGEMPVASNAAILPPAVRAQPLPVLHLPQPPAGSAPDVYRRPPPPRRVQARAAGG
jgi:beta-lactamase superfamily II metal-dependent hydrolase